MFFVLLRRMTLWPWSLTFCPWECFVYSASHVWPTYLFLLSYDYRLLSLRLLNIWSHFRYLKQSLRMRRVTWPLTGGKNSLHFWNLWPQFAYSLCHFHGATTKIKPCNRQKIAFSHYEGYRVYCACAVTRDLCIGGPPKPHVTIFWPRIVYSLYNFYGATMTIKGSFILENPHVKAVFGRKKKSEVQSKSIPEMAVFRKFKGSNIKYSHRDPQKALPYPERRHLTYFAKISVQGCRL